MGKPTVEYRVLEWLPDHRIGSDGSVWTLRPLWQRKGRTGEWRRLKEYVDKDGYMTVRTRVDGKDKWLKVHRLVCEAFHGPCPKGKQCRHLPDRNRANNRADNVRWSTPKESQGDRVEAGTHIRGTNHPFAKLDDDKVRRMRKMHYEEGYSQKAVGRFFNVSGPVARRAIRGESWAHVK